jgi:autotransporter-associated beta strand protein
MIRTKLWSFLALIGIVSWLPGPAPAAMFTWDGGDGSSTNMTTALNWVGDTAPSIVTNPATDELHFGPSAFTTVQAPGQMFIDQIIFDAGAPSYTFPITTAGGGNDIAMGTGPTKLLVNNSSNNQNLIAQLNLAGTTVKTPGAGLTIGGDAASYVYATSTTPGTQFWLTNDVTVNAPQLQAGARNVYGANGPATVPGDPTGTLFLNVASGTGTAAGSNFTGVVNIWSGAVRVAHSNALGRAANNTFIHGTFATATGVADQGVGGFDHGFGRLELTNDVTLIENVRIDGRQGDVADFDQVVNISGNNTLTNGTLSLGGAGHWNFSSQSGTLTLTKNMSSSDPTKSGGSIHANSVWTFRGAGDIALTGYLQQDAFPEVVTALRKQGTGTLTLSGSGTGSATWEGGTLIQAGTVLVTSATAFSSAGARIHVGGGTLDMSAVSGLTLGAGKTLSGSGTVKGNVVTNDATATINAGGNGSIDVNDLIAVSDNTGGLSLNNDLNMSAGGVMHWDLAALTTSLPGTNYDQLLIGGDLVLGGSSALTLDFDLLAGTGPDSASTFWDTNHTWKIIDTNTNAGGTNFAGITNSAFLRGTFNTSVEPNTGDVLLNFVAVPEPGSLAIAALAAIGLLATRRTTAFAC